MLAHSVPVAVRTSCRNFITGPRDNQEGGWLTGTNFFAGYLVKPPLALGNVGFNVFAGRPSPFLGLGGPC
jgi:hypothetical protein